MFPHAEKVKKSTMKVNKQAETHATSLGLGMAKQIHPDWVSAFAQRAFIQICHKGACTYTPDYFLQSKDQTGANIPGHHKAFYKKKKCKERGVLQRLLFKWLAGKKCD